MGAFVRKQKRLGTARRKPHHGFTIAELLVVVAVISILASLLLTSLSQAKGRAQGIQCLSNQRQLILACLLYADEHDDQFPNNYAEPETLRTIAEGSFENWANNVMTWELDEGNTNALWLRRWGLGPFLSGNITLFRCPSDRVLDPIQSSAGWAHRLRSVSMNAMVGNAGEITSAGFNTNNPSYKQFFRVMDVPDPATIFVFIEEHADSIRDGYFLNRAYSGQWHDLPASYHGGGANLAFADGHAEWHQWQHPSTRPPPEPDSANLPFPIPNDERDDFKWLFHHSTLKNLE